MRWYPFRAYDVKKIEEGIEVLTGMSAGVRNGDGAFAGGTVFAKVDERLGKMARVMKEFE